MGNRICCIVTRLGQDDRKTGVGSLADATNLPSALHLAVRHWGPSNPRVPLYWMLQEGA